MDPATPPPTPAKSPWRARALTLLKVGVTLLGLYAVASNMDARAILAVIRNVTPAWIAVGAVLIALSLVVRAYRWHIVLRGVGSTIRFARLVELYLVGSFFNAFLPSGLGGDVVRAAEAAQDVDASVAVSTVLVDRLTGLMALLGMALCVLPFRPPDFPAGLAWTIGGICAVGLLVGVALVDGRPARALMRFLPRSLREAGGGFIDRLTLAIERCGWRALAGALLVSLLFNLIQIAWWAATGRALGLDIPFTYYLLVVPIMSLALLVPSIGGLGVRENLAPALFAGAGISGAEAVALTLLVFGLERVASLLGAPVYLASILRPKRGKKGAEQAMRQP